MERVGDTIEDALLEIGAHDAYQDLQPHETKSAIRSLNRMMASHSEIAARLGYTPVASTSEFITVPNWSTEWIVKELAVKLAPQFDEPVSSELREQARTSYLKVRARAIVIGEPDRPDILPRGTANVGVGDSNYFAGKSPYGRARLNGNSAPTVITSNTPTPVLGSWVSVDSVGFSVDSSGIICSLLSADFDADISVQLAMRADSSQQTYNLYLAKKPSGGAFSVIEDTRRQVIVSSDTDSTFEFLFTEHLFPGDSIQLWAEGVNHSIDVVVPVCTVWISKNG